MLRVYCGYDSREPRAYDVCKASIEAHASRPVHVTPLRAEPLRNAGVHRRYSYMRKNQLIDAMNDEPHTTEFTFTRWLVPTLAYAVDGMTSGPVLFCDSDFLFRADIAELFDLFNPSYAVQVVKHRHADGADKKMWGLDQRYYDRKNWSSLALWNCGAEATKWLTISTVGRAAREWLHGFSWLSDSEIGSLPLEWNWLAGVSPPVDEVKACHYTLGTPDLPGYESSPYADEWLSYT